MLIAGEQSFSTKANHSDLDVPQSQRYSVAPAADADLPFLAALMTEHIPNLQGNFPAFEEVHRYSRSILSIRNENGLVGGFAALFLNHGGFKRLLDGSLSIADPGQSNLAPQGETAAAVYIWAICMPKMAVRAAGNAIDWLRQDAYSGADLYARPGTEKGKAFMVRLGFHPLAGCEAKSLWVYRRLNN